MGTRKTPRRGKKDDPQLSLDGGGSGGGGATPVELVDAAQARYLNYSLSVITSRALPDVRDGLKPVQRRILFAMEQLRIRADAKPRKCAFVCGNVTGNFHPHGEGAVYDALVRQAQSWVMRAPLVDGIGNFGSIDGDNAAAMRYTECRLTPVAATLLADLSSQTVPYRKNYDNTRDEPVVLPSRLPNLLVNGSSGIAVGMATNIPPHNVGEVIKACLKLLADPEIQDYRLVAKDAIQGPDFPTGAQIINTKEELREIYKTGSGAIKLRATTRDGGETRAGKVLIIDAIPYNVNKATLVEKIAQIVISRKMPLILDVKDLSTDEMRIDLILKKDADEAKVMAYLYKNTPLQTNFNVNLTCLVPTENPEVGAPARLGLKEILWHFLHFRFEVVTKRLEEELSGLEKRIHILDGFAIVFDALDAIIRIIRASDGKQDAAKKIMAKFKQLDDVQTDAILELKLYRLAKLEINIVLGERKEKSKRARAIKKLLKDDAADTLTSGRWGLVKSELDEIMDAHGKTPEGKRRSLIEGAGDEREFSEDDFIVDEDCHMLVTADGWIKRQKEIKEPSKSRIREGDSVLACLAGSTRATVGFFSSFGTCYTARFVDIPASTGYGEPIQKLFKLKDGERILAAYSFDPRMLGDVGDIDEKEPAPVHGLAAASDGYGMRFSIAAMIEKSTRSGRRYAKPTKGQTIQSVALVEGREYVMAISEKNRALICPVKDVNFLSGPGKGVQLCKLAPDDKLIGFGLSRSKKDAMTVLTKRGGKKEISRAKYKVTARGGKGVEIQKSGGMDRIVTDEVQAPVLPESDEE